MLYNTATLSFQPERMKEVVGSYFPVKRSGGDDLSEGKTLTPPVPASHGRNMIANINICLLQRAEVSRIWRLLSAELD